MALNLAQKSLKFYLPNSERTIGVPDKIVEGGGGEPEFGPKGQTGGLTGGVGRLLQAPDLKVFTFCFRILSNSEGLFVMKIHLTCPETQFSQTPG